MGRAAVRVIARTRPTDCLQKDCVQFLDDGRTIIAHTKTPEQVEAAAAASSPGSNTQPIDQVSKLDLVLRDASQEHVYDMAASDIVRSVMSGYNGTVMCYGQTGSGKTYTMMGGNDYNARGICPRAIKAVFDEVTNQPDRLYQIGVSFIEIYNERIRDLLEPNSKEDFAVLEDSKGCVMIRGAQQKLCAREEDALALLFEGNMNRTTAEHVLNALSSRSHGIFTLHVQSRSRVESDSASIVSKLHLIDLAGSERLAKTSSDGATQKEAQFINKSLTFLEQVVMALGASTRAHVPFRQSKLTSILKDSLGGNSKTTMIANIWPEDRHLEETLSTLRFAARMMRVQTDATVNTVKDPATQIKQLQRTITELKAELQMQNQLVGKSHISYDGDISEDERFEMEKLVKNYVAGTAPEIPVRSLREVKEYFRIFKAFVEQRDVEIQQAGKEAAPPASAATKGSVPSAPSSQQTDGKSGGHREKGIGQIDKSAGVSIGVAAPCKTLKDVLRTPQKPTSGLLAATPTAVRTPDPGEASTFENTTASLSPTREQNNNTEKEPPMEKGAAFDEYKRTAGGKMVEHIRQTQQQLQEKKKHIAELVRAVNDAKGAIDGYSLKLEQRRQDRVIRGEEETVDNEEFAIVKHVKEAKAIYTKHYQELHDTKLERDQLVRIAEAGRQQLLTDFETWYSMMFNTTNSNNNTNNNNTKKVDGSGDKPSQTTSPTKNRRVSLAKESSLLNPDTVEEPLDEGELFDLMQMQRVMDRDPEAVAYYSAKKMVKNKSRRSVAPPVGSHQGTR